MTTGIYQSVMFFAIIIGRAVEQIVSFIFLILFMMIYCLYSSSEVFV